MILALEALIHNSTSSLFCLPFTELEAMAAEVDAALSVAPSRPQGEDLESEFATEAPGEAKYRTLEQMSKDIKGLDEVGAESS